MTEELRRTVGASGRWVILSGRQDLPTALWPCRVHDMTGEFADVDLRLKGLRRGEGLALLGASDLLVSTAVDPDGAQRAQVIDLRTGAREVVSERKMSAVAVGNDEAAVLYSEAGAWSVERGPSWPPALQP